MSGADLIVHGVGFKLLEKHKGFNIVHEIRDDGQKIVQVHDPRYNTIYDVARDSRSQSIIERHNNVESARIFIDWFTADHGPANLSGQYIDLAGIIKFTPQVTYNNTRTSKKGKKLPDGIEIRFGDHKPVEAVRQLLKDHKFQFSELQKMWYALDNPTTRELAQKLEQSEVDVDDTVYEKLSFWTRLKSRGKFDSLRDWTEFTVHTIPPEFYKNKSSLLRAHPSIASLIRYPGVSHKVYYSRAVDDESTDPSDPSASNEPLNFEIADKLQARAEAMQEDIDYKLNPAVAKQNPTQKRLRVAQSMREDARRMQALQSILFGLAEAHRSGRIDAYPLLKKIRTVGDAKLLTLKADVPHAEFGSREDSLQRLGISSDEEWGKASLQAIQLGNAVHSTAVVQQNANEDAIKRLEATLLDKDIPGFFPTPFELAERLLELADLLEDDKVLEPSAGKGDLLDAIRKSFPDITLHAAEVNSTLREILTLKGYNLVAEDFLEHHPSYRYDKIIMNPPFEKGQDVEHVMHAYSLLSPQGRLVAIVSEGPFFRKFSKDTRFREFLNSNNAYVSESIDEAFKKSFNTASVRVRIIAINRNGAPLSPPAPSSSRSTQKEEDLEILELEAQAEIELVKLRIKNQNGVGLLPERNSENINEDLVDIMNFK